MDNQQQQRINRAAQEFTDALVAAYKTNWTCPDSVDTFPSRNILCSQFNLLELSGA